MESTFPNFALPTETDKCNWLDLQWLLNYRGQAAAEKYKERLNDIEISAAQSSDSSNNLSKSEVEENLAVIKSDTSN